MYINRSKLLIILLSHNFFIQKKVLSLSPAPFTILSSATD